MVIGCTLFFTQCTRSNRPTIEAVSIDSFIGADVAEMNNDALLALVAEQLERAKFTTLNDTKKSSGEQSRWLVTAAAQLGEPIAENDTSIVECAVALRFRQKSDGESFEVQSFVKSAKIENDLASIAKGSRELLKQALAQAVSDAAEIVNMTKWSNERLLQTVSTPGAKQAFAAARLLVSRKDHGAIDYLVQQLSSDDFDVARRAIGLLVELKSVSAVAPMIEASRGRDPSVQREVIYAIGAIGGDEAMAYLDLVATGHDDARLRAVATQAQSELRERYRREENK